jgi:hypothetical protein
MKIGTLIRFHDERFFDGAVQLRWVETQPEKARQAAQAFVFHGPRYHGANTAENDGIEEGYRLKDSASFVRDLLHSLQAGWRGEEENPYWMVVAGYGSGKSHLALTCAALLGKQDGVTESVLEHIEQADADLGAEVREQISRLDKPVLVLPLDGMAGFHLGNALSQAVFAQLRRYGVDAGAIRDLSPRFQTAEQFVQRNFAFRGDSFAQHLPGLDATAICARLRDNDEEIYTAVDAIYTDANGSPIPVVGQESAQELINTLCEVYCGPDGAFSSVVILFDEFGRYLEYAADKPRLAGDAALQQIFQGVQDNSGKVRFIGFIQYELKAYLKRFGSADLRQLQRYITRFDAAKKWYLSTNLETIFAHMIGKNEAELASFWRQAQAENQWQTSWRHLSQSLPGFHRFPVWSDFEQFSRVIGRGCWPLHPLATWFLTRQSDVVQSRSALTFIEEVIKHVANEDASTEGGLRQIGAAELVLKKSLLSELIAAERETGATTAETLQLLLEKFQAHLNSEQERVLAGVAVLTKMRVGKQSQDAMDRLIGEAAALESGKVSAALRVLGQELGALEWNGDLSQYELIADAASRGQFQQWLRKKLTAFSVDAVRDLFIRRGAKDSELRSIDSDFGHHRDIRTTEWVFEAQFAHVQTIESAVQRAFREWEEATAPNEAKGRVIYLYLHADDDLPSLQAKLQARLQAELQRTGQAKAPIWIIALLDSQGAIAEHIGRLEIFDESLPDDIERFRRFIPEERERSRLALQEAMQAAIKDRAWRVAGMAEAPSGRLRMVAEAIFASVYPDALPFPFDGFASGPGGPADAASLIRSLATGQVDGPWVQTQTVRLRNRVQAVLVNSWRALLPDGRLVAPTEPKVKAVYDWLQQTHQDHPAKTLWSSYRALIAPPYGMNASSAGLLLSLLLGNTSPPRRIEQNGEMVASGDWIAAAVHPQRHHFKQEILEKSALRYLSEDAESRWRALLDRWESEENYQKKIDLFQEAERMRRADPLPEKLEGQYNYLRDKANEAGQRLLAVRAERDEWERGIETADRHNDVGKLLKFGTLLSKQRQELEDNPCWSQADVAACDQLLMPLREMVSARIADWIPRQSCNTVAQVGDFRHRMEKAVASLKTLGFKREAEALDRQAQRAITQAEERQKFSLTLAESDDYPRQPEPTDSTPVRELHDAITQGDRLIEGIQAAATALTYDEITARVNAVKRRQERLRATLERRRQALRELYSANLENEVALEEILGRARRLREIFIDTRDEREISDMVAQLERVRADITSWESGDASPERLTELLQQYIRHHIPELSDFLAAKEIDPAWNLEAIYQAIAAERINAQKRRSTEWILPRRELAEQLQNLDLNRCIAFEREIMAAPAYLASDDREQAERLLIAIRSRRAELIEQARFAQVKAWQTPFLSLNNIEELDQYETERLLRELRNPPVELRQEEQVLMEPTLLRLMNRLDQISLDEIIGRIERLSMDQQRQLISILSERLAV